MAVSLVGEVVNSADTVTGYNQGNISGDDDNVEGLGAIGLKVSAAVAEMYTTALGATAPYDFSSGGSEEGFAIIMWFNTKTPINATAGLRILVGNGTDRGHWNVVPRSFYKGGFITQVVDTARDFDTIAAGAWTTTGNPTQLSNITEMGGVMQAITSIMGNFNNFQLDQFTIGLGVRVDGGTVGSPNTFETVRAADEDTNIWGWWSSALGSFVGKGKLFIGPATGTATSVFTDSAFAVVFADERVAVGFYEINIRGAGTDVTWDLGAISAAEPVNARWSLTVQSDTNSFSDTNGVWSGADQLTLAAAATLTGTTLIDCSKLIQNGATLSGCTVLSANTSDGVAFMEVDDPSLISNCSFEFSDGHAMELTTPGTYSFVGNTFSGYGADGTNDAAIYNNSGGLVTLNISGGGGTPTVRNGTGASTTLNSTVSITVTPLETGSEVRAFRVSDGVELDGVESSSGSSHVLSLPAGVAVNIVVLNYNPPREPVRIENVSFSVDQNLNPFQQVDRNFENP